ncbi:MAG: hypothetical protein ACKKL6_03215 [Candidatus Komeilibacteria bacterium]
MQNDIQNRRIQMGNMDKPSGNVKAIYNSKKLISAIIGVIILVLIVIFIGGKLVNSAAGDSYIMDGYQAVFVNNGETYFGKVTSMNSEVLVLEGVYYLQDQQPLQSGPQPKESELALIKLGSEIHGPRNQMIVPIESVSYIENLKETSAIVRAIQKSE